MVTARIVTVFKADTKKTTKEMVGLNMCDCISCSSPVVLHVPSPFGLCALARKKGGSGRLVPGARVWGSLRPPREAGGFGGAQGPVTNPMI